MRTSLVLTVMLASCSSAAHPAPAGPTTPAPPATISPELSPALAPLAWWLGDWQSEHGTEHWVAVSGAIYGIALTPDGSFEVMIVDDGEGIAPADGVLRFIAMPGGGSSTEFTQQAVGTQRVTFANPAHDDPKAITYERAGTNLRAIVDGTKQLTFSFRPVPRQPASELEAADRAFGADTAARGIEGWVAAFDPKGGMLNKGTRVEGAALRETMTPVLASYTIAWEPVASHRAGPIGFTVGKATFTGKTPAQGWRSTYVTIWRKQPDGAWKVLFDTGRPVNEPSL